MLHGDLGSYEQAIEGYRQAIRLNPANENWHLNLKTILGEAERQRLRGHLTRREDDRRNHDKAR